MKLLTGLFFAVWIASIVLRPVLAAVVVRRGLVGRYPIFFVFLLVSAAQSAHRLYAGWMGGQARYEAAWNASQWISLVLMLAVVVECFLLYARHFRRFFAPGVIAGGGVILIAGLMSFAARWVDGAENELVLVTTYSAVFCFSAVTLTHLMFRGGFGLDYFVPNVSRHSRLLQWLFFSQALGHFVQGGVRRGLWFDVASAYITTGGMLVCVCFWFRALKRDGEINPPPAPLPPEEAEKRKRRIRTLYTTAGG